GDERHGQDVRRHAECHDGRGRLAEQPLASVSVPPDSLIVPSVAPVLTVPKPVKVAGLVSVMSLASVSVPREGLIVPPVAVCAALMVRLPPEVISNVWLALWRVMPAAEVAVPKIFRSEPAVVSTCSTTPLLTVSLTFSVPPLAFSVPVPET